MQEAVRAQIDYYFSVGNLVRDVFLRSKMNGEVGAGCWRWVLGCSAVPGLRGVPAPAGARWAVLGVLHAGLA